MNVVVILGASAAFKAKAFIEHSHSRIDVSCCPTITNVDGLQMLTFPKHIIHVCNLMSVKACEVDLRQTQASLEQALHVSHFAGHEVLNAFYLLQIELVGEPIEQTGGSCGDERWVKDYFPDIFSADHPIWAGSSSRQAVDGSFFLILFVIGIERECGRCLIEHNIGSVGYARKIARIGCATIDVGVLCGYLTAIVRRACSALDVGATSEHVVA